jgi:hypothetical protein
VSLQPERITLGRALPPEFIGELIEFGFMILPTAVSTGRIAEITAAYDDLMVSGSSPDFKGWQQNDSAVLCG